MNQTYSIFKGITFSLDYSGGPYKCLPSGSYSIKCSNGQFLGKNLQDRSKFIAENYELIDWIKISEIAQFIIDSNANNHRVIKSKSELKDCDKYKVAENKIIKIINYLSYPRIIFGENWNSLLCTSFYGWMHQKSDIYSHRIRINKEMGVIAVKSRLLIRDVAYGFPSIRY
jgi:hypothetical protein